MRLTIFSKLFLSLFSVSIVMVVGMSILINYSFTKGFQTYLNKLEVEKISSIAKQLPKYYDSKMHWQELINHPRLWDELFVKIGEPPPVKQQIRRFREIYNQKLPKPNRINPRPKREDNQKQAPLLNPISHRVYLSDVDKNLIAGTMEEPLKNKLNIARIAVKQDGKTIGWLNLGQRNILSGPLVSSFYAQQKTTFYLIVFLAGLFSLLATILLVRHFLNPLKKIDSGAKALSKGEFDARIEVKGSDELAQLSQAFNALALSLKQQKQTREQWITDISHELRTPIAVLRGEIEAIQDGIRKPEVKYIHSMHQQVLNLGKLVDDLYLLSRSDSGIFQINRRCINLVEVIDSVTEDFEYRLQEKGLLLERNYDPLGDIKIQGDIKTLTQLCNNLLENSLRYTNAPGKVIVSILDKPDCVVWTIEDTSPSVATEHLPKLFERLYRVDQSRSREFGGSGLGLSICQNIVKLHQGSIQASASSLGGIAIEVILSKSEQAYDTTNYSSR